MSAIKTVAVAGATGNIGKPILNQLIEDGFKVTALTRKGTSHTFPPSVTVAEVDYESPESLVKALQGQDAVVSAVGFNGLPLQLPLIDAAVKAGVKRFLPSEYGGDAENAKAAALPIFAPKKQVLDALTAAAAVKGGSLTYTLVSTGPFLDMALGFGLFVNLREKSATLWNGGDRAFSTTTTTATATAVAQVLKHPQETRNRTVRVRSASTTQNKLLAIAKEVLGGEGWTTKVASTEDALKRAHASLETGKVDRVAFITETIWGEGYGCDFEKVDNELLGVRELSEAEIQGLIEGLTKTK
ncbi:NAD(P)-binding protein [Hypoxylon sp. FL1150]|nr:NAD(P)-binding protein [Hypoxylon sp. FL1150]